MTSNKILAAVLRISARHHARTPLSRHLDIGPGTGELIALFREYFGVESKACDCTLDRMRLPGQEIDLLDLNRDRKLPYPDADFDVVTGTELVEHLEDFRGLIREIHRVLRPGGFCVLSTPNVLNLNSRLRYLWFGFPVLFGPLPVGDRSLGSTAGHITPVPYFYLAHALLEAGFYSLELEFDKPQRSGLLKLIPLYLPLKLFSALAWRRETGKYKTIDEANAPLVRQVNSRGMLLGRTIILAARK
ncbi:MAG: class I SAM-dependent methyltransferase [Thermodesulfobacteriota bacterium]